MPTLDKIVDRNALIVKSNISILNAIVLMSGIEDRNISRSNPSNTRKVLKKSSCVLVVEEMELVGIFTERDALKAIVSKVDLANKPIAEVMTREVITLKQYQDRHVSIALKIMEKYKIRHLPVVGNWGQLIGNITRENIRAFLTPGNLLKMRCVSDVMNSEVVQSSPEISLISLGEMMRDRQVSCVVIVENQTRDDLNLTIPVGIVTESDILRFQVLNLDFSSTRVETVMTKPLFPVRPSYSLWGTHQLMLSKKVRRLVVVDDRGALAGIITQSSILQVFDPLEMSRVITVLEQQIDKKTKELERSNQQLKQINQELAERESDKQFQAQRLQNLGSLASAIAGDLNNFLTPILAASDLLSVKFPNADEQTRELFKLLNDNSKYSLELVRKMLTFANQSEEKLVELEILPLLCQVVNTAKIIFSKSIEILIDRPEDRNIPKVFGNAILLHQALMNLCINARDTMPNGGTLKICLETEFVDKKFAKLNNLESFGSYLVILFWDTGVGIPEEVQEKIFEPLESEEDRGKRLTIVSNIIKNHRGFIDLYSEVGKGSQFKVYLPALTS